LSRISSERVCGRHSLRQRLVDDFARLLNLGLAFARDDDRMGIGVMNLRDGAGDAGHLGRNDVDWPSGWQCKFLQRPDAAHLLHYAGETFFARLVLTMTLRMQWRVRW
jgi:hypothetical protein